MAGTFTDQATLASDNAFINKCRAAMIFRAVELMNSAGKEPFKTLLEMNSVLRNAGASAQNMAWLVATGDPTIASAAPVLPEDSAVQSAVNIFLPGIV